MIEPGHQPDMCGGEVRPPSVDGVVNLSPQVLVMLTGKLRNLLPRVSLCILAMTGSADSAVNLPTLRSELA